MKKINKIPVKRSLLIVLALCPMAGNRLSANDSSVSWEFSGVTAIVASNALVEANGLNVTYFLDPLAYVNGPIAERYFLNPTDAIRISATYENATNEIFGFDTIGVGSHFSYSRVLGDSVITPRIFYSDYESAATLGVGVDYSLLLGQGAQAYVSAALSSEEISRGSTTTSILGLGYRKLWQYKSGRSLGLKFELDYTRAKNESGRNNTLTLGTRLDYYLTHSWATSLGLSVAGSDVLRQQSLGLDLSTEYFFTDKLSISADINAQLRDSLDAGASLNTSIYFD